MKIDPKTLLFTDIPPETRTEMYETVKAMVLVGKPLSWPHPQWVQDWMQTAGFDERQALLVMSTALPQRVLLSLMEESPK